MPLPCATTGRGAEGGHRTAGVCRPTQSLRVRVRVPASPYAHGGGTGSTLMPAAPWCHCLHEERLRAHHLGRGPRLWERRTAVREIPEVAASRSYAGAVADEEEHERPRWRPLRIRLQGADAEAEFDALHEGVPPWLKPSILRWIREQRPKCEETQRVKILQLQRRLKLSLDWSSGTRGAIGELLERSSAEDEFCFDMVDYFLQDLRLWVSSDEDQLLTMDQMLLEAGSAWEVVARGEDEQGLNSSDGSRSPWCRRHTTRSRRTRLASISRRHGTRPNGRAPDPSQAYLEAVRAVRPRHAPWSPRRTARPPWARSSLPFEMRPASGRSC